MRNGSKHWLARLGPVAIVVGLALAVWSQTGPTEFPDPGVGVDPAAYRDQLDAIKAAAALRIRAGLVGYYMVIVGGFSWIAGLIHSLPESRSHED